MQAPPTPPSHRVVAGEPPSEREVTHWISGSYEHSASTWCYRDDFCNASIIHVYEGHVMDG
jgi:hypothetical protein